MILAHYTDNDGNYMNFSSKLFKSYTLKITR